MSRRIPIAIVIAFLIVYGSSFFMIVSSLSSEPSGFGQRDSMSWSILGYNTYSLCFDEWLKPEPMIWQWWCYATAWLTNPLLWFAVIATLCHSHRIAIGLAISAMLHAIPVLFVLDHLPNGPGYYIWVSSAFILIAGNVYLMRRIKRSMS